LLDYSPEYAATVTSALNDMLGGAEPTTRFVIDTSRNGQGPWTPDPDAGYPDAQDWCNPPGRGVGLRPTTDTGTPLLDAVLWVKVPGESDGSCNRGIEGSTTDPEWGGIVDPAAGAWFPEQALQLARLASPPLR
jgi:endoglucanase